MRLAIFDVDGTLTRSTAVDADCYARAVSDHLAVEIETDWSTYQHVTDAGILREILDRHGIAESPSVVAAVRDRFLRLLSEAIAADPACCRQVPGARTLLESLRNDPDLQLAIATGAWADAARMKLRHANLAALPLPLASSDDAPSREEILRIALKRAATVAGRSFDAVTYVGDGSWDVAAARSLGFDFIGIAYDGDSDRLRSAGATVVFPDFTNHDAFVRQLR